MYFDPSFTRQASNLCITAILDALLSSLCRYTILHAVARIVKAYYRPDLKGKTNEMEGRRILTRALKAFDE